MTLERKTDMIEAHDLPESWFDRPQYRPRVRIGLGEIWFPRHPAFLPVLKVPEGAPAEPHQGREALRAAFEETYRRWDLPRGLETERSLALVGSAGTAVVVTGQQPGFLGGPLYTLYKALTAVAVARKYRALTSRPCVSVFWVVSEDHDLEEVKSAHFPGGGSPGVAFTFPATADRRPLSGYPIDAAACAVLDAAGAHLGRRRHGDISSRLIEAYRGRNLASGFAALMARLIGHTGILFLDPALLRPATVHVLRSVLDRPEDILASIERGRSEVKGRGLEPLVAARLPLFIFREGRRDHLKATAGGFQIDGGGPDIGREELLRTLRESPDLFSTGALLRPIVEMTALPSILTVGGPGEVGYFAQVGPLADYFQVPRPRIGLRLCATLVDGKPARTAREIPLETIARAAAPEDLLEKGGEPAAIKRVHALAEDVERALLAAVDEISGPAEAPRLRSRAAGVKAEVIRLAGRIEKAASSRQVERIEAARKLWEFILPAGQLQERTWNVLHFVAKHGTAWIDEIVERLEQDPLRLAHKWMVFRDAAREGED